MSAFNELIFKIVLTLVGVIAGFLLGYRSRRPKLLLQGHGSGSNPAAGRDLMLTEVYIYNNPSFCGLKVNRDTAVITTAHIYDPELDEFVGPSLVWRKDDSSRELEQ